MVWSQEYLDLALVPSGLLIMIGYHLSLLYNLVNSPHKTAIGHENHNRRIWVERIWQIDPEKRGFAVAVISGKIWAAASLASASLSLSSLIGALMGSSSDNIFKSAFVYGDKHATILSIKYISLLICFLVAFVFFLQCMKCFVDANVIISIPNTDIASREAQRPVIRGNLFWSAGMRALYFGVPLLFWIFGPIPMFVASLTIVIVLPMFDFTSVPLRSLPLRSHNCCKTMGILKVVMSHVEKK